MSILNMLIGGIASGAITEYETGQYSPSSDTMSPSVSFSNIHTEAPAIILFVDDTGQVPTSNSRAVWFFANWEKIFGAWMTGAGGTRGEIRSIYAANTSDDVKFENGTASSYATATGFLPKTTKTTVFVRASRTYSWIALWMPSE